MVVDVPALGAFGQNSEWPPDPRSTLRPGDLPPESRPPGDTAGNSVTNYSCAASEQDSVGVRAERRASWRRPRVGERRHRRRHVLVVRHWEGVSMARRAPSFSPTGRARLVCVHTVAGRYVRQEAFRDKGRAHHWDAGRFLPHSGQVLPASHNFGQLRAHFCRDWVDAGRIRMNSGQLRSELGLFRPNSANLGPESAKLGRLDLGPDSTKRG